MPSATRLCSTESTRDPPSVVVMRSWSPPVKKTPVAVMIAAAASGPLACSRSSRRSGVTRPAPSRLNTRWYSTSRCCGSLLAVAITTMCPDRPPASSTNLARIVSDGACICSAPPISSSGPPVFSSAVAGAGAATGRNCTGRAASCWARLITFCGVRAGLAAAACEAV
ncbi:hypothetical protein GCM10009558_058900 [Virgisporangium aurantiacum]